MSARLSRLLEAHPILSSIAGIVVVVVIVGNVAFALSGLLTSALGLDRVVAIALGDGAAKLVSALVFFLIMRQQGWTTLAGFNRPTQWKHAWLIWLPCLYVGVNFINLIGAQFVPHPNAMQIAARAFWGVPVALFEETTYRGFVLAVMLNRYHATRAQVVGCVLFSSVLFGLMHLPNDSHWETNVAQWLSAAFAGVGFSGVLLRTRSIWLLIIVHALIIAANAVTGGLIVQPVPTDWDVRLSALLSVVATLPLPFYGLYLIRDITRLDLPGPHLSRSESSMSNTASATASG